MKNNYKYQNISEFDVDSQSVKRMDDELRCTLKAGLLSPGDEEWFARRLLNRLPDKKPSAIPQMLQGLCYLMAVGGMLAIWVYLMINTLTTGLSVQTIAIAALLPMVALCCLLIFVVPILKRS